MRNLFTDPPHLPLIAPSILSADFANLGSDCQAVLDTKSGGADLLHVDVMDGHFVPNLTLGPAHVSALRKTLPDAFLDVHLMVTDPQQYIEPFAHAGANHITFHIEPVLDIHAGSGVSPLSAGYDPKELAAQIRSLSMTAGLALNPGTDASTILDLVDMFDLILVMSVNPGFGGQAFIENVLPKVETIRAYLSPQQRLEMDGGIGPDNAHKVQSSGCDVLVAGSAIFGLPKALWGPTIASLRGSFASDS